MDPFIAERAEFVRGLHRHGAFSQYATADDALAMLDKPTFLLGIAEFQKATGEEVSLANMDRTTDPEDEPVFFCGQPTIAPFRSTVCQWPQRPARITFTTTGALGPISAPEFMACAVMTMGWWAEVCGIIPVAVTDPNGANIVMYAKHLDGPNGVLAQMMLPCGASSTSKMQGQFDLERLVISDNPPNGTLDLARIMCHELGHALGSDHIASGNLLAPTYSRSVRKPQRGDVAEMTKRYGQPAPRPTPTPDPVPTPTPTPGDQTIILTLRGGEIVRPVHLPGWTCIKQ